MKLRSNNSFGGKFISILDEVHISDVKNVEGENASLDEMYNTLTSKGFIVPPDLN